MRNQWRKEHWKHTIPAISAALSQTQKMDTYKPSHENQQTMAYIQNLLSEMFTAFVLCFQGTHQISPLQLLYMYCKRKSFVKITASLLCFAWISLELALELALSGRRGFNRKCYLTNFTWVMCSVSCIVAEENPMLRFWTWPDGQTLIITHTHTHTQGEGGGEESLGGRRWELNW